MGLKEIGGKGRKGNWEEIKGEKMEVIKSEGKGQKERNGENKAEETGPRIKTEKKETRRKEKSASGE